MEQVKKSIIEYTSYVFSMSAKWTPCHMGFVRCARDTHLRPLLFSSCTVHSCHVLYCERERRHQRRWDFVINIGTVKNQTQPVVRSSYKGTTRKDTRDINFFIGSFQEEMKLIFNNLPHLIIFWKPLHKPSCKPNTLQRLFTLPDLAQLLIEGYKQTSSEFRTNFMHK